uniref:26S proteasome complex subunit SEM1 n=1 Tax=Strigamia maritima TaxID=126957 RepID=T1J0B8_STRMM
MVFFILSVICKAPYKLFLLVSVVLCLSITSSSILRKRAFEMAETKKIDLGLLEEDDEFEEFPAEDWTGKAEDDEDVNVWEDNWDDDNVEDDFSKQLSKVTTKNVTSSFDSFMKLRREEARRTVVVEVESNAVAKSLLANESENVSRAYFYQVADGNTFLLMEFKSQSHLVSFMNGANYSNKNESPPVFSHFLKFKGSVTSKKATGSISTPFIDCSQRKYNEFEEALFESKNVSDQMQKLYDATKLEDIQFRFRFLICKQLEDAFVSLLPFNQVKPFGSSVNGFGNFNSDADMVLLINPIENKQSERLTFQDKIIEKNCAFFNPPPNPSTTTDRRLHQITLEIYADALHCFVPGCTEILKILRARVPIVKFHHQFTGLDCDLATANDSALVMSEFLYLFGEYDKRVRPLVFTVFRWARSVGITNSSAGHWFTNFQLSLMVIYYLQQMKKPVLPGLNELRIDGGIKNLFIQDIQNFPSLENDADLGQLLRGFFDFYQSFEFSEFGLSINKGSPLYKNDRNAMYIENPLDEKLNVCQNVSFQERKKFVELAAAAVYHLDRNQSRSNVKNKWGILSLFQPSAKEKPTIVVNNYMTFPAKSSHVVAEYQTIPNTKNRRHHCQVSDRIVLSDRCLQYVCRCVTFTVVYITPGIIMKLVNIWIFAFALSLLCLAQSKRSGRDLIDDIDDLKDFKKLLRTKTNVLVLFVKSERESVAALKLFADVAEAVHGQGTLAYINCDSDAKKLCKKLKANPNPTVMKHFKDGEFNKDYDRRHTVQSIVNFMKDPTGDVPWEEDPALGSVFHIPNSFAFDKLLRKEPKPLLVMFYAPWCGFCKRLKPVFAEAATELRGGSILAAMDVNKPENAAVRQHFNITGFPTLLYFEKGQFKFKYEGDNTKDGIVKFMNNPQQPPEKPKEEEWSAVESEVLHLTDETFDTTITERSAVMVMFYAPWCGHCKAMKPEYVDAAARLSNEEVNGALGAVDATKETNLASRFQIKGYPSGNLNGEYKYDVNFRTADKIVEFMKDPKEPPPPPPPEKSWADTESDIVHLDEANFKSFMKRKKHVLVIFYAPWCGHCKKAKPEFSAAASQFKDDSRVAFAAVDCTANTQVCSSYQVEGYPTMKYFSFLKTVKPYEGGRTANDFVAFMRNPHVSPSDATDEWLGVVGAENIHQLTSSSFEQFLKMYSSTFILFCNHVLKDCQTIKPQFALAASELKNNQGLTLGYVNVDNEADFLRRLAVSQYPSVKYFRKSVPFDYKDQINSKNLLAFVNKLKNPKDEF